MGQLDAVCPQCGTVVPLPKSMVNEATAAGGLILMCPQCRQQFDWPCGIGTDSWWDELGYRRCSTFALKGAFILTKLLQRDAAKLRYVMVDLYRAEQKDPQDITKFEWETILRYMGASSEEIADVQARMGRQWR